MYSLPVLNLYCDSWTDTLMQVFYEFLYTGIGQMIAAYAPNAVFASLVNPLIITTMVSFCGVMVPYSQIEPFWRYW